jgi:hypothetical protein
VVGELETLKMLQFCGDRRTLLNRELVYGSILTHTSITGLVLKVT